MRKEALYPLRALFAQIGAASEEDPIPMEFQEERGAPHRQQYAYALSDDIQAKRRGGKEGEVVVGG